MWRVEPIREVLTKDYGVSVSPSCYYAFRYRGKSAREIGDERLGAMIAAIYAANYSCYGVRKMWRALLNEGQAAARRGPRQSETRDRCPQACESRRRPGAT